MISYVDLVGLTLQIAGVFLILTDFYLDNKYSIPTPVIDLSARDALSRVKDYLDLLQDRRRQATKIGTIGALSTLAGLVLQLLVLI